MVSGVGSFAHDLSDQCGLNLHSDADLMIRRMMRRRSPNRVRCASDYDGSFDQRERSVDVTYEHRSAHCSAI